jgi:hypothetical protein
MVRALREADGASKRSEVDHGASPFIVAQVDPRRDFGKGFIGKFRQSSIRNSARLKLPKIA